MTKLENQIKEFISRGLSEEERKNIESEVPISFKLISKEILCGYFKITSGHKAVKIIPTAIEIYYHEEAENGIKDSIVYHKNTIKNPNRPLYNIGFLHTHISGIDITFEFKSSDNKICRASALIREYQIIDSNTNEILEINNVDSRSTFFPSALLGQFSIFDGFSINWCDSDKNVSDREIVTTTRVGLNEKGEITKEQVNRKWNFRLAIKDEDTNVVYISEKLKTYSNFYNRLVNTFENADIRHEELTATKDIWVRDFMPIQLSEKTFVRYKYAPDYLYVHPNDKKYITNSYQTCDNLKKSHLKGQVDSFQETDLIIDGGNVVICGNTIIMTDKVLKENTAENRAKRSSNRKIEFKDIIIEDLSDIFGGRKIILIPWTAPATSDYKKEDDVYGHADGLIKYIGGNRILMSAHRMHHPDEADAIIETLNANGFEVTEMDFSNMEDKTSHFKYHWAYINFLQVGNKIIMPTFNVTEDKVAKKYIQEAFPQCKIYELEMNSIASKGGALHCITWNIKNCV